MEWTSATANQMATGRGQPWVYSGKRVSVHKRFPSWTQAAPADMFSGWTTLACGEPSPPVQLELDDAEKLEICASADPLFGGMDPLYLFACHVEWERRSEPSAAWELLAAVQAGDGDARAQALALLATSYKVAAGALRAESCNGANPSGQRRRPI